MTEIICGQSEMYIDCRNPADWLFLTSKANVDDDIANTMLDILAKTGAIDASLWERKIIWVQSVVDSVSDVFAKRKTEIPRKPDFCSRNDSAPAVSVPEIPQSIVDKTIVDKTISFAHVNEQESLLDDGENIEPIEAHGVGEKSADHSKTHQQNEFFDAFYRAYPRKVGKPNARKAFIKLGVNAEMLEEILAGIGRWLKTSQWQDSLKNNNGDYIPYPATFLNRRQWEDDIPIGINGSGVFEDADPDDAWAAIDQAAARRQ